MVSLAARSAARTAWSIESRSTSGMEATGVRTLVPSTTKSGQMRSSVVSTCSRTRRRTHSERRFLRGRIARSRRCSLGASRSAGQGRVRSSGRPNLIAIVSTPSDGTLFGFGSYPLHHRLATLSPSWLICKGSRRHSLVPAPDAQRRTIMSDQAQKTPTRRSDLLEPVHAGKNVSASGSWAEYLVLFLRIMAGVSLVKGLYHWAQVCGIGAAADGGFESHTVAWQTATVFFAVIDLVAAVGLWLAAAWGAVVWLTAVVSMAVVEVF